MKWLVAVSLIVVAGAALVAGQSPGSQSASSRAEVRFEAADVYVDSKEKPLAAYQIEIWDSRHTMKIVGIEGGAHAAFKEPPRYDPAALQNDRVVLAAFHTGIDLPKGRARVARLHVAVSEATPLYQTRLVAAASADGQKIIAEIELSKGDGP